MTSDVTQELKHHTNCVTEWLKAGEERQAVVCCVAFFFFFLFN